MGDILKQAHLPGCKTTVAEETVRTSDGDLLNLRYLFSPDGARSVPLIDLEDDEWVPEREIISWERRLGIRIPR